MVATYRLQLTPDFTFADAEALVPYFADLGVSHLYLSPITEAVPGSTHGYDAIDHGAVREAFGGRAGFESLREAAVGAGLGLILDFVPNHAGVHAGNARWQYALAHGPHAEPQFFDIDWEAGRGKAQMPFLGTSYGDALGSEDDRDGDIALVFEKGRLFAAYYDHRFALSPASYADVLGAALGEASGDADSHALPPDSDAKALADDYRALSPGDADGAEALRPRLRELAETTDLEARLDALPGAVLHDLLEQQHWRLAHWRTAMATINYRRFFQINDLAALRQEDDAVFQDTHRLVAELCAEEGVTGLRIDHIDGLTDPQAYLERLRDDLGIEHVWVEKILTAGETLPGAWPTHGTSGYAFMNDALQVLTDPTGEDALTETYRALVPGAASFHEEERAGRLDVMETTLAADRHLLAAHLHQIATADYRTRDLDGPTLGAAIEEVAAAFERYRTYLPHDPEGAEAVLDDVIAEAKEQRAFSGRDPYGFLKAVMLGDVREDLRADARDWALRFQQFTAPVAAKGVEDAAFYRYNRLIALNEVGGTPQRVGLSVEDFHRRCAFRAEHCPETLLATATHDHKRGEDTRMRLATLAEHTDAWHTAAERLDALAEEIGDRPHPADAYLFYQVLAALWPERDGDDFEDRLAAYVEKACRESGRETRWIDADDAYEERADAFARGLATYPETDEALGDLPQKMAAGGFRNSLTQLLLKCTTAGTPDFYQGRTLMDFSLVDPDNRRPVDYAHRRELLSEMQPDLDAGTPRTDALRSWIEAQDERAKFFFAACLLQLRRAHEALFSEGSHTALALDGPGAAQWIAFAREHQGTTLAVVAPRFPARHASGKTGTTLTLPEGLAGHTLTDALTGTSVTPDGDTLALPSALPWAVLAVS